MIKNINTQLPTSPEVLVENSNIISVDSSHKKARNLYMKNYMKKHYQEYREKKLQYLKEYREANREYLRTYNRERYHKLKLIKQQMNTSNTQDESDNKVNHNNPSLAPL
jgi:hypothetical protein